jgi:hypothetical protein
VSLHRTVAWRAPAGGLGALAIVLAMLTVASPVLAAGDCDPVAAAFSPGKWSARGIQISKIDHDDRSVVIIEGDGGFTLSISETGDADGTFSLAGTGMSKSFVENDESGLEVQWMTTGKLSGNGSLVRADGTRDLAISGQIDANPNGDGDDWGNEFQTFGNETTTEYHGTFSPSAANCNTVFGSLRGPVAYGSADGGDSLFMAVRIGKSPDNIDIEGQLVELLDRAQEVLRGDAEPEILDRFVRDLLAFDALLLSIEYCDALQANVGPIWAMLRETMISAAHQFLAAAYADAYSTRDVIFTMTSVIQGGTMGWRGPECLEPQPFADDAEGLLVKFEDVLLKRLEYAWLIPDSRAGERLAELAQIAAAAYQFGLGRVTAAMEGHGMEGDAAEGVQPEDVQPDGEQPEGEQPEVIEGVQQ